MFQFSIFETLGHWNLIENSCLPAGRKNYKLKINLGYPQFDTLSYILRLLK